MRRRCVSLTVCAGVDEDDDGRLQVAQDGLHLARLRVLGYDFHHLLYAIHHASGLADLDDRGVPTVLLREPLNFRRHRRGEEEGLSVDHLRLLFHRDGLLLLLVLGTKVA